MNKAEALKYAGKKNPGGNIIEDIICIICICGWFCVMMSS